MTEYMQKSLTRRRRPKLWLLILSLIIVFFVSVISLVVIKKSCVKAILKKHPAIYSVVQNLTHFDKDKLTNWFKGNKPGRKLLKAAIEVDAAVTLERYDRFWGGFGHDFFYSGVTGSRNRAFFKLVAEANKKRKIFNYYRSHNIFTDRNSPGGQPSGGKVYSEDAFGNPLYNWERVDRVFDTITQSGMKPIVELGFMPDALTSDPNRIGDWRAANVAPPQDYMKWRNLVYETVAHLQERYGAEEIESWYFEVWNEPDLPHHFWVPDPNNPKRTHLEAYYKLYDYAVDGALAANANIKIGGPAIAGWPYVFEGFLSHTKEGTNFVNGTKGSRIDFFSFHKYGYVTKGIITPSTKLIDGALKIDKKKFSAIPFLLDEFGPATSSREQWKNTPYVSAWICKAVDGFFEIGYKKGKSYRPTVMIYWSDIGKNYKEGSGPLATIPGNNPEYILKGPVFNAYELLGYLGNERIQLKGTDFGDEIRGIATKNQDESVEVLLYKISDDDPYNYDIGTINLVVKNLPFKKYYVKQFIIDRTHSNAYHYWRKLGSPKYPNNEQIGFLQSKDDLEMAEPVAQYISATAVVNDTLKIEGNGALLLIFSKVTDDIPPLAPATLKAPVISENSITLSWSDPPVASDDDVALAYRIYRNGEILANSFVTHLVDSNLVDNTEYLYLVYSVDDQGNRSISPVERQFTTLRDDIPPKIINFYMPDASSLVFTFNKRLNEKSATDQTNYFISNGIELKEALLNGNGCCLALSTTPHVKGADYVINLENTRDCAKQPNYLDKPEWRYKFELKFTDHFEMNSCDQYRWVHEEKEGGFGQREYDAKNKRMKVLTGDNVSEKFSRLVPLLSKGTFSLSFLPFAKYPSGGAITIKLKADERNYYELSNTDGYGPGKIEKYIDGQIVDSASFSNQYSQKIPYRISIDFSSSLTRVDAFDQVLILKSDNQKIRVKEFEIKLAQQDAFFDDIKYVDESVD